jgi:polar amino acid transport system substrate-binding protein
VSKIKKFGLFLLPVFMLFIQFIPLKTVLAETTDPYYEKIQQKGELIVGLSADYAPYELMEKIRLLALIFQLHKK